MEISYFSAEELLQLEQLKILGGNANPLVTQVGCAQGVCSQDACSQSGCAQSNCGEKPQVGCTPQLGCIIVAPQSHCGCPIKG